MRWLAAIALAGCGGAPKAPLANTASHEARLAIADGGTVRIVRLAGNRLTVEQATQVPDEVGLIYWVGDAPAVWIKPNAFDRGMGRIYEDHPDNVNAMGFVTRSGYVAFGPVTWPPQPKPKADEFGEASPDDQPDLIVTAKDELWQRHCAWHAGPDGGGCVHWTSARRYPPPLVISEADLAGIGAVRLPKLAAPAGIAFQRAHRHEHEDDDPESGDEILRCSSGGRVTEFPAKGSELEHAYVLDPEWIGAQPPLVRASSTFYAGVGVAGPDQHTIFEGCDVSARYRDAVAGPDELVAVFGPKALAVYQHGAQIATLDVGGSVAVFAP